MIRFGVTSISKPGICFYFQSIVFKTGNTELTRLLRPFSCSLSHHYNQSTITTIKSANLLYKPSQDSLFTCYNPVLTSSTINNSGRFIHTMNVSRNQNKNQTSTINNQSSDRNLDDNSTTHGNNNQPVDPKDRKGRFKALIRDYGLTAVIFHVTISLASLGICYLLVNSSLPMEKIFIWLGIDKKLGDLTDAASTSTNFVVAYAVHKSFALIRLSITAASVPVIVRYLRSKGILKPVAKVVKKVD